MVKLVFCLRRAPHLSREEFQKYWYEKHAPLVSQHAKALRLECYVQTHSLPPAASAAIRASRGAPEPYDGVAELWWRSLDDMTAATASDAGREAGLTLLEDERRFIDLSASPLFFCEEREVVAGGQVVGGGTAS